MSGAEMVYRQLRDKTGKHRAHNLQSKVLREGFAMRMPRLESPESLQEIGDDKANHVRRDARPEGGSAPAHERVSQKHEKKRDADADAHETQHLGQVGPISHQRAHINALICEGRMRQKQEAGPAPELNSVNTRSTGA
jgi:hypothetical protein